MKIGYVSDLHLEYGPVTLPGGDILLLAGDLIHEHSIRNHRFEKTFENFVKEELSKYKMTYYVLGNHEHYNGLIDLTSEVMMDHFSALNAKVTILDDGSCIQLSKNWKLIGCTLWTDYCNGLPHAKDAARTGMNDHRCIRIAKDNYRRFDPDDAERINVLSRLALTTYMNTLDVAKFIVMTHHTPSMKSGHPRWGGDQNLLNYAFHNTGLNSYIESSPNVKYWIHGHTHDSADYKIGECRVLCNPKGYGKENAVGFNPNLTFEVNDD